MLVDAVLFSCKNAIGFDQLPAQPGSFSSAKEWFCSISDFCVSSHGEVELDNEVLETAEGDAVCIYGLANMRMCWASSRLIRNACL